MGLNTKQYITLDFTISRLQNIYSSQDDNDSRYIVIALSDNGKPYTIPDASVLYLKISKPDGKFVYIDENDSKHLYRNNDGTISILLSEQATCVPGICETELQVINGNEILTSQKFNIVVRKSAVSYDEIESQIETNVIKNINAHMSTKSSIDGTVGHVSLTDSISSNSTTTAATANSVKKLNDLVSEKYQLKGEYATLENVNSSYNNAIKYTDLKISKLNLNSAAEKGVISSTSPSYISSTYDYVPDMSVLAYWNGAYDKNGKSYLAYCNKGAFGDVVTKNMTDLSGIFLKKENGNDFTTEEKNKLNGIADGANKTTVDNTISGTSTNPVQNKVIYDALKKKYDSETIRIKCTVLAAPSTNDGVASFRKLLSDDIPGIISVELEKTANLDTLTDKNFTCYYCSGSNTVVNNPEQGKSFGLYVYRSATGYITQELVSQTGKKYVRFHNSTEWSSWNRILFSGDTSDSTSASAIGTGTALVTERDVYYGLPKINNVHTYNSNTNIYAPTSVGTSEYTLHSNGNGAPSWVNIGEVVTNKQLAFSVSSSGAITRLEDSYTLTAGTWIIHNRVYTNSAVGRYTCRTINATDNISLGDDYLMYKTTGAGGYETLEWIDIVTLTATKTCYPAIAVRPDSGSTAYNFTLSTKAIRIK